MMHPANELKPETREKIFEGALDAIGRHGLKKLSMSDVSEAGGVSRGTLYRYFPGKDDLLEGLAQFEVLRFQQKLMESLNGQENNEERLRVILDFIVSQIHEHRALRRLRENEPDLVVSYLRGSFPTLRLAINSLLEPIVSDTVPVRMGIASSDQLGDWVIRILLSLVLVPDADPNGVIDGMLAMYRVLMNDMSPASNGELVSFAALG